MSEQPEQIVEALLDTVTIPTKHSLNSNPELVAAIKYFLEQKAAGDPRAKHLSFSWFYREKLRKQFDGPTVATARLYVRDVMKLDRITGKAL